MNNIYLVSLVFLTVLLGCKQSNKNSPTSNTEDITSQKTIQLSHDSNFNTEKQLLAQSVGTQAFLFGAALSTQIYFRNRMKKMIEVAKNPKSPLKFSAAANDGLHFNELIHTSALANHEMKIAGTPNVDTRYSIVFFNLEHGAQVLEVPPIKDRYYSINITDAYLGNRPYICSRKGDVNGGTYIFTGPSWSEKIPDNMTQIEMPQNNFLVVLRIFVRDPETDNENVTNIQNQFRLQSLDKYLGKVEEEKLVPVEGVPMKKGVEYFQQMVGFMQANPPEGHQDFIWNLLGQVEVSQTESYNIENLEEPIRLGLKQGIENGKKIIQWRAKQRGDQTPSGWHYSYTMGVDHEDYMHRSEWAVQGLTVGSPKEAMFFNIFTDSKGGVLDGAKSYEIHIPADKMPPVGEFWSITSYDEKFNLVVNEDYHYGVGSRNPNLKYNEDGSLTFKVQNTKPEEGLSNWIPTPETGAFKLTFRFYHPKEVMFDKAQVGNYLPFVEEVAFKN